jgi:hypothetical protein
MGSRFRSYVSDSPKSPIHSSPFKYLTHSDLSAPTYKNVETFATQDHRTGVPMGGLHENLHLTHGVGELMVAKSQKSTQKVSTYK